MSWAQRDAEDAELEMGRIAGLQAQLDRANAECRRLREAIETQAAAVRTLNSARASQTALDQRVLASLEAEDRATLLAGMDALKAERDAFNASATDLRDIIEGRTTEPTEAEMMAHEAAGGLWRWVSTMDGACIRGRSADAEPWVWGNPLELLPKRGGSVYVTRYWALDSRGVPTAWPKVKP